MVCVNRTTSIVKILNIYTMLLCTHFYHSSFRYLSLYRCSDVSGYTLSLITVASVWCTGNISGIYTTKVLSPYQLYLTYSTIARHTKLMNH